MRNSELLRDLVSSERDSAHFCRSVEIFAGRRLFCGRQAANLTVPAVLFDLHVVEPIVMIVLLSTLDPPTCPGNSTR